MTVPRGRAVAGATASAVALLAVTLTSCTSPTPVGAAHVRSATTASSASSTPAEPSSTAPAASAAPSSTSADGTTPAVRATSASARSGSSAPPVQSTCRHLTIRVLLGGAAPGYEFAALQFVNTGSSSCVLAGAPTVALARSGAPVGTQSQPADDAAGATFRLGPGATAESQLRDFSGCNAPLSDEITVVAPGSTISTTRPGELRACSLRVYPLQKGQ